MPETPDQFTQLTDFEAQAIARDITHAIYGNIDIRAAIENAMRSDDMMLVVDRMREYFPQPGAVNAALGMARENCIAALERAFGQRKDSPDGQTETDHADALDPTDL